MRVTAILVNRLPQTGAFVFIHRTAEACIHMLPHDLLRFKMEGALRKPHNVSHPTPLLQTPDDAIFHREDVPGGIAARS